MKESFTQWQPQYATATLLAKANTILEDYTNQGYVLTLRQLYYQLVAKGLIPNTVPSYKRIGNIINRGRLAGYIDWAYIEDRVRHPQANAHWENPKQIIDSAAYSYYIDRWVGQENYIEVWSEKDSMSGIFAPICRKYDVVYMANRGYTSQTAMYNSYYRLLRKAEARQNVTLLYFGDHDPSGIDMVYDIRARLGLFTTRSQGKSLDIVNRLALNMNQVEEYNPPENPAKPTDTRYQMYIEKFGRSSWELDALEPKVLADLLESTILKYIDMDKFNAREAEENEGKDFIKNAYDSDMEPREWV